MQVSTGNEKKPAGRPRGTRTGLRLNGLISTQAGEELYLINQQFGTNKYDIISTAVVFYAKAMRGEMLFAPSKTTTTRQPGAETRSQNALKAVWCNELGGRMEGNICHIDKYEMTLAGTVDKMPRSIPLSDLPNTKEDFMSFILGGFNSLTQAREASNK